MGEGADLLLGEAGGDEGSNGVVLRGSGIDQTIMKLTGRPHLAISASMRGGGRGRDPGRATLCARSAGQFCGPRVASSPAHSLTLREDAELRHD